MFSAVWFHNRVPLVPDMTAIILLYDVVYTWHVFVHTMYCCGCRRCSASCYAPVAAAAADAVCHRVPDGRNCCWFIGSDSIQCFLCLHTWLAFNVPLGSTVAFTASIWLLYYIFGKSCARWQKLLLVYWIWFHPVFSFSSQMACF